MNALLDACDRLYLHRYRLLATAVMSVFLCTGLRKEDVRGLRLRNVHFGPSQEDNYLVAEHSKGDKEFRALMPPETVRALRDWLEERQQIELPRG